MENERNVLSSRMQKNVLLTSKTQVKSGKCSNKSGQIVAHGTLDVINMTI